MSSSEPGGMIFWGFLMKQNIAEVKWLTEHGISEDRLSLSKGSGWIKFNSTVGEVEDLLKTKYKVGCTDFSNIEY